MSITIEELYKRGSVEVHASGKLHKSEYDQLVPLLEDVIKEHGKVRLLFIMEDFHGWEVAAFLEEIKFDLKHFKHFDRIALVGDKTWEKWMAKFCTPFVTGEVRYFPAEQEDEARNWLLDDRQAA